MSSLSILGKAQDSEIRIETMSMLRVAARAVTGAIGAAGARRRIKIG